MTIDRIEVFREAHQLELDYGLRAHLYANKLAVEAHEKELVDEEEFWNAVAASLRPRTMPSYLT